MNKRERSDAISKTMSLFAVLFPTRTISEIQRASTLAVDELAAEPAPVVQTLDEQERRV